jgi:hypothetical protein
MAPKAAQLGAVGFQLDDWPAIHAGLVELTARAIHEATGLSNPWVTRLRAGKAIPDAEHWPTLAALTGLGGSVVAEEL